jgi:transposase
MGYIKGTDRFQASLLPDYLEDYVSQDNPVRIINAFVDKTDLKACGFTKTVPASEGRPAYSPNTLVKLFVYSYYNKIRSSRKISRETERNIEAMWLCNKLTPDFRTVADFRKDNVKALKNLFRAWNLFCAEQDLFGKELVSIDGSKFKAVNSKDRNFTLSKLDDRLKRIDGHIAEYLSGLEKADSEETDERKLSKEEIAEKIAVLTERKTRYAGYLTELETTGETQKSLTDTESRLMKFNSGGCGVGYNVQTAVDDKNHLIADFEVTNKPTDNGLLGGIAQSVKKEFGVNIIETSADKGYRKIEDISVCLENGIIPNVHPAEKFDAYVLQAEHEPADISDGRRNSTKPEDIKACLRAGVVPEVYNGRIEDMQVVNVKIREDQAFENESFDSPDAMIDKAKQGFFVRDLERNLVYCPAGEILRFNARLKDKSIYRNKLACQYCMNKCCKAKYKQVAFTHGKNLIANSAFNRTQYAKRIPNRKITCKKFVRFVFRPNQRALDKRKCLSEHPFGTVKHWNDSPYLLLRGKDKASGELALSFLAYNIRRALNAIGFDKMLAILS